MGNTKHIGVAYADPELDSVETLELSLRGTKITASATEINKLKNAGSVVASGTRAAKIDDPADGTTIDAEARSAINSIIDALQAFGIVAT